MKYEEIIKGITEEGMVAVGSLAEILDAISQVYPMILLANLTKNSYFMIRDNGFLYEKNSIYGEYDEMIENGVKNIHPSYQSAFLEAFDRKSLIARYENGIRTVSVNLYQKDQKGDFHWVTTKVIRLEDESGDVVQLCLNENLPE